MPDVTGLTDAGEAVALNALAAAATQLALSTTPVQEDGTGATDPTAPTYAHQAATFGALTAGEPSTIENAAEVSFGDLEPTTASESIGYWAALDASGDALFGGAFAQAVTVQQGVADPVSFAAGAASCTIG